MNILPNNYWVKEIITLSFMQCLFCLKYNVHNVTHILSFNPNQSLINHEACYYVEKKKVES